MLESCLDCCRKHLACAIIYLEEAHLGYRVHRWLAVGELNHAEKESLEKYPDLAARIREQRLIVMKSHESSKNARILPLIALATHLCGEDEDLVLDPGNSKTFSFQDVSSNDFIPMPEKDYTLLSERAMAQLVEARR